MKPKISYQRSRIDKQILGKLLPDYVNVQLADNRSYVYTAIDSVSGNVVGVAVFTMPETLHTAAQLLYVIVDSEHRNLGVAGNLIDYGCDEIKSAGAGYVFYRQISENAEDLITPFEFAVNIDFHAVSVGTGLLVYSADTVVRNPVIKKVISEHKKYISICTINNFSDPLILKYNQKVKNVFEIISESTVNLELSRFVVRDDAILAGVLVAPVNAGVLMIHGHFPNVSESEKQEGMKILIAKVIAEGILNEEIRTVCIRESYEWSSRAMTEILGIPEMHYREINLVRTL
ncbi:MAG: GNAT family N-acetyltransferase [Lachnospiraceae bacterium]|nr:GNAT family N-acetyltransferase [Lachnospiraceae bacterium]